MTTRTLRVAHVPFTPTSGQRRAALLNVREEIEGLVRILTHLHSAPLHDIVLRDALLERLASHLRTLRTFLEAESRTVHYASGIRQENDDVLAADYEFPPTPLPISDAARLALRRSGQLLSYSAAPAQYDAGRRLELLTLALPILRRCAAFVTHLLSTPLLDDETVRSEWQELLLKLGPFADRAPAARPPEPDSP